MTSLLIIVLAWHFFPRLSPFFILMQINTQIGFFNRFRRIYPKLSFCCFPLGCRKSPVYYPFHSKPRSHYLKSQHTSKYTYVFDDSPEEELFSMDKFIQECGGLRRNNTSTVWRVMKKQYLLFDDLSRSRRRDLLWDHVRGSVSRVVQWRELLLSRISYFQICHGSKGTWLGYCEQEGTNRHSLIGLTEKAYLDLQETLGWESIRQVGVRQATSTDEQVGSSSQSTVTQTNKNINHTIDKGMKESLWTRRTMFIVRMPGRMTVHQVTEYMWDSYT